MTSRFHLLARGDLARPGAVRCPRPVTRQRPAGAGDYPARRGPAGRRPASAVRRGDGTTSVDVTEGGLVVSPRENERRAKALRELLSTPPPDGKNLIIVSHKPNRQDAAGKEFGDLTEGEVVVFKPLGDGKFKAVARVTPDTWGKWVK